MPTTRLEMMAGVPDPENVQTPNATRYTLKVYCNGDEEEVRNMLDWLRWVFQTHPTGSKLLESGIDRNGIGWLDLDRTSCPAPPHPAIERPDPNVPRIVFEERDSSHDRRQLNREIMQQLMDMWLR